MKRILILGASSQIGKSISAQYANNSEITLIGRSTTKLKETQKICYKSGAKKAYIIIQDFSKPLNGQILDLYKYKFDIIINLISGSSRILDKQLNGELLCKLVKSDVLYVIKFFNNIVKKSKHPIKIIFITSILEDIKTPNRFFYGAVKNILSIYFNNVQNNFSNVKLLSVKIGTRIDYKSSTKKTIALAKKILNADRQNKVKVDFGLEGFFLKTIFYIFPLFVNVIIRMSRTTKIKID